MKITGIQDVKGFFETVEKCEGDVELVTSEGDRLNLKSRLSQFVSLANFFSADAAPDIEIIARDEKDEARLRKYLRE